MPFRVERTLFWTVGRLSPITGEFYRFASVIESRGHKMHFLHVAPMNHREHNRKGMQDKTVVGEKHMKIFKSEGKKRKGEV